MPGWLTNEHHNLLWCEREGQSGAQNPAQNAAAAGLSVQKEDLPVQKSRFVRLESRFEAQSSQLFPSKSPPFVSETLSPTGS